MSSHVQYLIVHCHALFDIQTIHQLKCTARKFQAAFDQDDFWKARLASDFAIKNNTKDHYQQAYVAQHVASKRLRWDQRECIAKLNHGNGIFDMTMGSGKTLSALSATFSSEGTNLVLAPKTVISTWLSEIRKFYGFGIPILVWNRAAAPPREFARYRYVFVTYEGLGAEYSRNIYQNLVIKRGRGRFPLPNLYAWRDVPKGFSIFNILKLRGPSGLFSMQWHYLILDEAHRVRNPRTLSFIAAFSVTANHYLALTGTPVINRAKDKESLVRLVSCVYQAPFPSNFVEVDFAVRSELPTTVHNIETSLTEVQKDCYNRELSRLKDSVDNKETGKVLSCITKLREICLSMYTWEQKPTYEDMFLASPKIQAALEILDRVIASNEKAIVFSGSNTTLVKLHEHTGGILLTGQTTMATRNNIRSLLDASDILFSNFTVGGSGLNLEAANHVILLEPWWNSALEEQAIARVLRPGQKRHVHVYNIVARNTIEYYMLRIKSEKIRLYDHPGCQSSMLKAMERILANHGSYSSPAP